MGLWGQIKKLNADDALDLAVRALDVIGGLAGSANASNAKDIVMVIRRVYEAVVEASEGTLTKEQVEAELSKLVAGLRSNDAAADTAIDDKFDKG